MSVFTFGNFECGGQPNRVCANHVRNRGVSELDTDLSLDLELIMWCNLKMREPLLSV